MYGLSRVVCGSQGLTSVHGMFGHDCKLVEQRVRTIGQFRLAQSFNAQVFFAIDQGELGRQPAHKFAAYSGVNALKARVGLFGTNVKRVVIDGPAISKSYYLSVYT